ncbi:MAG: sensor histidine kinase N-terminal domain-containing protein [Burkholderiales bacterium]|nr:sensor histidine kinase N-terminal domain-containing protein [Burkholderiales bacterium]
MLGSVSIRTQLLRRLTLPLLVLLTLGGLVSYGLALHFSQRAYDAGLYDAARSLAQQIRFVSGRATLDLPRAAIEMFEWDVLDHTYFAVLSAKHGLVLGHPEFPRPVAAPAEMLAPAYYDATFQGRPIRSVAVRLPAQDDSITVLVGETLVKRTALTREILLAMILPELFLAFAALLLLVRSIRAGLEPLHAVAQQIERRSPGDLEPIADAGPTEVRPLTRALNELLRVLSAAQASQQRFIANAAHQLRSPLAALQVQAERALRDSNPASHARALERVAAGTRRVAHVSRQLLTLARLEPEANAAARFVTVDLAALAREATAQWVPQALERGLDLGYAGEQGAVPRQGDPALLQELVSNLIDNAIRYGMPGNSVTVGVESGPDRSARLYVEDDGPGIAAEFRQTVFDRFVRLPDSHGEGCGLGLAIVREIAHLHGGEAHIETSAAGRGARVAVHFG